MMARRLTRFLRRLSTTGVALAVVLLMSLALRLYALDWDEGQDLHPDELFVAKIVMVDRIRFEWPPDLGRLLDPATSGLNPRSVDPATGQFREFAYGALPLFVTDAAAGVLSRLTNTDWNAGDRVYLVGRVLSAVLDTVTVGLVFLIGRRLGGPVVGLLGALVASLAPMSIQLAHFFTTDSWLTTFVALCLLFSIRAVELATPSATMLAGGAAGLAMATKGSAFLLVPLVALAAVLPSWTWRGWRGPFPLVRPTAALSRLTVAGVSALVAFACFEPFALTRPDVYAQSLRTQADIVAGVFDVPFTRVFASASPLHAFEQLARWGFGPPAALAAAVGLVLLAKMAVRGKRAAAILLAWVVVYGLVVSGSEVQFLRYLAPVTPVLAVAAGVALAAMRRRAAVHSRSVDGRFLFAAALVSVAFWTSAFIGIYAGEHPRLAASRWMYSVLPPGSTVTAEYWDDALPRDFDPTLASVPSGFETLSVDLYADRPAAEAADALYDVLDRADAIVLSSGRVESAVRANPWRYPVQSRFYDLLAEERLGFRLGGEWQRPPALGPVILDDRHADESFINYDHPRVRVYLRTEPIERGAYNDLMAWAIERPWQPTRHPIGQSLLLDRPVGDLPVVDDARWSASVTGTTAGALVVWLLLLGVLQVVGYPLARIAFGRFFDAGWGFGRLVALLLAGYLVWIGSSLQLISFRAVWCGVALTLVGALGWVASKRSSRHPSTEFAWWRPPNHGAAWCEGVFWLVFAVFLAFRFVNPDGWHPFWGGEKPMEFAHLNATLRSAHFPPFDPWYADGYLNYYYYGTYLVAFLLKLTGIPSEIGFNLAQPMVMALLASGVYSLAASLGRGVTRRRGAIAGVVAVLLVIVIGNLTSAHRLVQSIATSAPLDFGSFLDWTWAGSRAIAGTITEFPFFTGLYADLHAHVVALPITVLAIALAYALVLEPYRFTEVRRLPNALRLLGLALVLGTLSATNAWDVPIYALLAVAAIWMSNRIEHRWGVRLATFATVSAGLAALGYALFLPFHVRFVALFGSLAPVADPSSLSEWTLHVGGLAAVCALGFIFLMFPRHLPRPFGWLRAEVVVIGIASAALLSAVTNQIPGIGGIVPGKVIVGIVVLCVLAAGWLAVQSGDVIDRVPVIVGGVVAAAAVLVDRPVLALAGAGLAAATSGWLFASPTPRQFYCLLVAAAMGVVAGVELVVVADDLISGPAYRMNTVFKFYNQVWILLAIAAAISVAAMTAAATRRSKIVAPRVTGSDIGGTNAAEYTMDSRNGNVDGGPPSSVKGRWAIFGLAVATLVVAASLLYPAFAVGPRLAQRFPDRPPVGTLNALGWMGSGEVLSEGAPSGSIAFAGDLATIDWFNREVAGSPVIAEASIGPYRCNGSRISIATGLPTIIGWERHESQQRLADELPERVADVDRLYRSREPQEKEGILRRYNVEYVVVGDLERAYPIPDNGCTATGSVAGIAAFDEMIGESLEVAFADAGTTVYRVLPSPSP